MAYVNKDGIEFLIQNTTPKCVVGLYDAATQALCMLGTRSTNRTYSLPFYLLFFTERYYGQKFWHTIALTRCVALNELFSISEL